MWQSVRCKRRTERQQLDYTKERYSEAVLKSLFLPKKIMATFLLGILIVIEFLFLFSKWT